MSLRSIQFKSVFSLYYSLFFFALFFNCGFSLLAVNLSMGGSTTLAPLIENAIPEIQKKHPDWHLTYQALGSSVGIVSTIDGTYTIGGSSRDLIEQEIKSKIGIFPVALDAILVIINDSVPIKHLSLTQLAYIFNGKFSNWKQLGGPDHSIVLFNRDESSGTYTSFNQGTLEKIFPHSPLSDPSPYALICASNGEMTIKVDSTPYSIGYISFAYQDSLKHSHAVAINHHYPLFKNIQSGVYPLVRPLYLLVMPNNQKLAIVSQFFHFLYSQQGSQVIRSSGFIDIKKQTHSFF